MRIRAELEFYHDKSHQMRNARCEMRNAPSFERPVLILKPAHGEGTAYASFKVGTGVRHITMFSRNSNPSRVYDTLARFGTVSLIYPHQDIGWIVYFENEERACEAESKISEIYKIDSIKRIVHIPCCLLESRRSHSFFAANRFHSLSGIFPRRYFESFPKFDYHCPTFCPFIWLHY